MTNERQILRRTLPTISAVASESLDGFWVNQKWKAYVTTSAASAVTFNFNVRPDPATGWSPLELSGVSDISLSATGTTGYVLETFGADEIQVDVTVNGSSIDIDVIFEPVFDSPSN